MANWFYQIEGREHGPFASADLLQLIRDRTIDQETLVRKDSSAWFPAGQVGGLFEAAAKPTIEYECPTCSSRVSKPPTYCRRCRRVLDYARPLFKENVIDGYQPPEREKESITDSWKQWVRRLKVQRDERNKGPEKEE